MVETFQQNRIGEIRMSSGRNMSRDSERSMASALSIPYRPASRPRDVYAPATSLPARWTSWAWTSACLSERSRHAFHQERRGRHAACRARRMNANVWANFRPDGASRGVSTIRRKASLSWFCRELELKGIMISGNVHRYIPQVEQEAPEQALRDEATTWQWIAN